MGTLIIKSIETRSFTGFISVEDVDLEGDLILIDAIDKGMPPFLKSGGQMQIVHSNIPVGRVISHFVTKDPNTGNPAMAFFGEIFNDGREIHDIVWNKMVSDPSSVGFSIGVRPLSERTEYRNGKRARIIDKLEVYEFSVIADVGMTRTPPTPANSGAILLGLGHSTDFLNVPRPITVKMVLDNMPDDTENTENPTEKSEETEETVDSQNSGPDEETIRKRLQNEWESAVGGKQAITALQKKQQEVLVLQKQLTAVMKENTELESKIDELKGNEIVFLNKSKELEYERNFWKETAMSTDHTNQFLNKMINEGNAVINDGGMPTLTKGYNQRTTVEKQNNTKTIQTVEKFVDSEVRLDDDQEFLKTIRNLERMNGGN